MTSPTMRLRRRRRLLALATAGLALCIGVSVTSLAAWQQNIQVTPGTNAIGSSLLQIEISLDGGQTWNTATVNSNGNLQFTGNAALLTPGDTVYASVLLRAAKKSSGATVKLSGGAVSDALIDVLTYAARANIPFTQCNKTTYPTLSSLLGAGTDLVAASTALTAGSGNSTFTVQPGTANAAGPEVGVCLAITLPAGVLNTVGGKATTPLWQFDATSI